MSSLLCILFVVSVLFLSTSQTSHGMSSVRRGGSRPLCCSAVELPVPRVCLPHGHSFAFTASQHRPLLPDKGGKRASSDFSRVRVSFCNCLGPALLLWDLFVACSLFRLSSCCLAQIPFLLSSVFLCFSKIFVLLKIFPSLSHESSYISIMFSLFSSWIV